jgi:TolA-binding protein
MDDSMRSEWFEPRAPLPRRVPLTDKPFGPDEEFEPAETDVAVAHTHDEETAALRPSRVAALWFGMAVLGVVLAFAWHSVDAEKWLSFAAPSSSSASSAASSPSASSAASSPSASSPAEEQLGRIARDLDVLKKNIDELRAAQQQTVNNVTSLQAAQQELQRRASSVQSSRWYSDSALLTHPAAPAKKPVAVVAPKRVPIARPPAQTHDANVGQHNDGAPVSLVSPEH